MKAAILLALVAPLALMAQESSVRLLRLENGAQVAYQIFSEIETPRNSVRSVAEASGNVIKRFLRNPDGSAWFGFQVQVDKTGDSTFRVSFAAMPGVPFFAQAPEPREIHDGDRVMLDVLEQPSTGKKVFDTFQVCLPGTPSAQLPLPDHSVPGVIPSGTPIRLARPRVFPEPHRLMIFQSNNISFDAHVGIEAPGVGKFTFAADQGPGFRLEAVAEGNTLRFLARNETYLITTEAPIVDKPGAWLLWVHLDPQAPANPKFEPSVDGPAPIDVTVSSSPGTTMPLIFEDVKNVSSKNIVAYQILTSWINPDTGKSMSSGGHGTMLIYENGLPNYLVPGQSRRSPKPMNAVKGADNVKPQFQVSVDLVVFEDGSTWGPMTSPRSRQMLKAVQLWLANKK